MARINNYIKDLLFEDDDLLLGSSYEGEGMTGPLYKTANYRLDDLATYMDGKLKYTQFINSIGTVDSSGAIIDINSDFAQKLTFAAEQTVNQIAQDLATLSTNYDNFVIGYDNELIDLNADIAAALQEAIDAGTLATTANTNIATEIINRTSADSALAGRVDTVEAVFTFSTVDGSITGAAGALNQTINLAASTAAGAVALRVDVLEAEYNINTQTGAITSLATNSVTNTAISTVTGAIADRTSVLETQFNISNGVVTGFSSAAQTRIDQAISTATSAQFSVIDEIATQFVFTNGNITATSDVINSYVSNSISTATSAKFAEVDEIKTQFVFTNGNITSTADVLDSTITTSISNATSAQFTKLDEIATQFTFVGGNITGVADIVSSTINTSKTEAISSATTAANSYTDTFGAKIVTLDSNGNITGLATAFQTEVLDVVAGQQYASVSELNEIKTQFVYTGDNITGVADVVSSTINSSKLEAISSATSASNSYTDTLGAKIATFDTNGNLTDLTANVKSKVNAAVGADGYIKVDTVDTLLAEIVTKDVNGNITGFTSAVTQDIKDVIATESYASASSVSTLSTTVAGNTASISTNASTISTVNGKLTASYGLTVDAGGRVAGLKLLADGTTGSEFIARANTFGVDMPNGTRVLTVNSSGLTVNGSGTFSGTVSATAGSIGGWVIGSTDIHSSSNEIVLDSSSKYIRVNGAGGEFAELARNLTYGVNKVSVGSNGIFVGNNEYLSSGNPRGHLSISNVTDTLSVAIGGPVGGTFSSFYLGGVAGSSAISAGNGGLYAYNNTTANNGKGIYVGAGDVYVIDDVVANASDQRLKEDIQVIPNALEKVNSIKGITYKWNDKALELGAGKDKKNRVGVIAQEIQAILPEATTLAPFDDNNGESITGDNYLTVLYDKLTPLLIEAVKELSAKVDRLEKELSEK